MNSNILRRSSFCPGEPTDIVHTYTLNGDTHHMTRAEFDSVEVTGRDSILHYLTTPSIPHRHVLLTSVEVMEGRPGKTTPGASPSDTSTPKGKGGRTTKAGIGTSYTHDVWHLKKRDGRPGCMDTACGGKGGTGFVFGFARFARMKKHAKACVMCCAAWNGEIMSGDYRTMDKKTLIKALAA